MTELEEAVEAWRRAEALAADAKCDLIDAITEAISSGMSEYQAAKAVGVQRLTVRHWIGK